VTAAIPSSRSIIGGLLVIWSQIWIIDSIYASLEVNKTKLNLPRGKAGESDVFG
jgi:hypothetical protein